jgi:hypothetical protein
MKECMSALLNYVSIIQQLYKLSLVLCLAYARCLNNDLLSQASKRVLAVEESASLLVLALAECWYYWPPSQCLDALY